MHYLSTSVQLAGTLVTGYGLLYAYGRAKSLPARIREWWARIRRRPPRNVSIGAHLSVEAQLSAEAHRPFTFDQNATTDEKLAQLETYVRKLRIMFDNPVKAEIARLDRAIDQAKEHANAAAEQSLTAAKVELQRFGDRLNELQAVDLSVAAAGAFIMAAGYVLSYFGW
jgi:uncharacterized membrane protein YccC